MKPSRTQMREQMEKVNKLACESLKESTKFNKMCTEYYGEETYNDHNLDQIIDCLDYGQREMEFEEFDELMKEINTDAS